MELMTELPISARLSSDNDFNLDSRKELIKATENLTSQMDKKMKKVKVNEVKKGLNIKLIQRFMIQRKKKEEFLNDLSLPKVKINVTCANRDPFQQYDMMEALCVRHLLNKSLILLEQGKGVM